MSSIRKVELKSGKVSYEARFRDKAGKSRSKSFSRRKDAAAFLSDVERRVRRGTWVAPEDQRSTVRELLEAAALAARTVNTRKLKELVANNLGPLADIPVGRVHTDDVDDWLRACREGRPWAKGATLTYTASDLRKCRASHRFW